MSDTQPSNIEAAKRHFLDQAREFGRVQGAGMKARLDFAALACQAGHDGLINPDDAEQAWNALIEGSADETKDIGGLSSRDRNAQRVSDLRHFIVLGANRQLDGPMLLDNARRIMADLRLTGATQNARVWELMLAFARAQNKAPERALADPEIRDLMADKAAAGKAKADKINGAVNILKKVIDEDGDESGRLGEMVELGLTEIGELGGTSKDKRRAERAAAKLAKEKAKKTPQATRV